jgi:triacylglycerol lipase
MFFPPEFDQTVAAEAGGLVLQAYQQYTNFTQGKPWSISAGYQNLGNFEARATELALQKEPFGFVAQNLSSKKVFVTFRGTQSFLDWMADFTLPQTAHPWGAVEKGFSFIYSQCSASALTAVARAPGAPVFVTGHSLGAALAVIATADLVIHNAPAGMYSFAGPRTGDPNFAAEFNKRVAARWRIVNSEDLVTTVPLASTRLGVVSGPQVVAAALSRLDKLDYEHVGDSIPFTVHRGSIAGNHDMQLYLDVISGSTAAIPVAGNEPRP